MLNKPLNLNGLENIFFCQAYNDISFILEKIKRHDLKNNLVVVLNNAGVYDFFDNHFKNNSLFKIIFIKTYFKSFYNIFYLIKEKYNLYLINKNFLKLTEKKKITIHAYLEDLITCYCVEKLKIKNKIYLSIPVLEKDNFIPYKKSTIFLKFLSSFYSSNLISYNHSGKISYGFSKKYSEKIISYDLISESNFNEIYKQYSISLTDELDYIVFLDSPDGPLIDRYKNYKEMLAKVFNIISNYNTYIKGSRQGISNLSQNYNFKYFDNKIPIEFIDLSKAKCIISLSSQGLSNLINLGYKGVNINNLFEFYDLDLKEIKSIYFEHNCNEKFYNPQNISDFENILKHF
jgi:hypothetical protein